MTDKIWKHQGQRGTQLARDFYLVAALPDFYERWKRYCLHPVGLVNVEE